MSRLHACTPARLHACTPARLHACTPARLHTHDETRRQDAPMYSAEDARAHTAREHHPPLNIRSLRLRPSSDYAPPHLPPRWLWLLPWLRHIAQLHPESAVVQTLLRMRPVSMDQRCRIPQRGPSDARHANAISWPWPRVRCVWGSTSSELLQLHDGGGTGVPWYIWR
jgi:hypothetical protein